MEIAMTNTMSAVTQHVAVEAEIEAAHTRGKISVVI